jgi:Skp family chaperone for outer membrane proteins
MAQTRVSSPAAMLLAGLAVAVVAGPPPAHAQAPAQQPEWFVPGGQGNRPGAAPPAARPGQAPARPAAGQPARPAQQAAPALPPGQQPPAAVIGIVDLDEIRTASTAFGVVREEIERRRQRLNDDLQREQNNWREAQQSLANQRATMQPDQLRTRERELQDRITDSQRIFRERSRGIEQAAQAALVEIEQTVGLAVRQVASSRGVNLVLTRPAVLMNDRPFDLTEEVAGQVNRVLRSVTLAPETTGDAATPAAAPATAAAPAARPAPAQGQRPAR